MIVWKSFFAENPYGAVPLVLYQIIQLSAGNLLAARMRSREEDRDDPA